MSIIAIQSRFNLLRRRRITIPIRIPIGSIIRRSSSDTTFLDEEEYRTCDESECEYGGADPDTCFRAGAET